MGIWRGKPTNEILLDYVGFIHHCFLKHPLQFGRNISNFDMNLVDQTMETSPLDILWIFQKSQKPYFWQRGVFPHWINSVNRIHNPVFKRREKQVAGIYKIHINGILKATGTGGTPGLLDALEARQQSDWSVTGCAFGQVPGEQQSWHLWSFQQGGFRWDSYWILFWNWHMMNYSWWFSSPEKGVLNMLKLWIPKCNVTRYVTRCWRAARQNSWVEDVPRLFERRTFFKRHGKLPNKLLPSPRFSNSFFPVFFPCFFLLVEFCSLSNWPAWYLSFLPRWKSDWRPWSRWGQKRHWAMTDTPILRYLKLAKINKNDQILGFPMDFPNLLTTTHRHRRSIGSGGPLHWTGCLQQGAAAKRGCDNPIDLERGLPKTDFFCQKWDCQKLISDLDKSFSAKNQLPLFVSWSTFCRKTWWIFAAQVFFRFFSANTSNFFNARPVSMVLGPK